MSEATSATYTTTGPTLVGAWLFAAADPAGTLANFLHVDARTVATEAQSEELRFAGRALPVVEYGEHEGATISLTALVPWGSTHDALVQWWRDAVAARRTVCYRDGRGRLYWCAIIGALTEADRREGTGLGLTLLEVDYDEAVA